MSDPDPRERLEQLEERISALKAKDAPKPHMDNHYSQAQLAWRMVIDLVVGIGMGFGMGYGLDSLLGSQPVFIILMTMLGFAAGVRTMLRSAEEMQRRRGAPDGKEG